MPVVHPAVAPLRTQVGLILAKPELSFNTDSVPTVSEDAFLVEKIDYKVTPQVLRRNPQRRSLSAYRFKVGRKEAEVTFDHEVKGSGIAGLEAKFATLLRGCGFAMTTVPDTLAGTVGIPFFLCAEANSVAAQALTWVRTAAVGLSPKACYGRYNITCILGGASATAKLRVSGNPADIDNTILASEEFQAAVYGVNPTTTLVASGTPTAPIFTVGGTAKTDDILCAIVGGIPFYYKLTSTDTLATAAAGLAALIALDARFVGTNDADGTHREVIAAVINNPGTGGTPGAVTLTGTTGTGTKFQATGVINTAGVLTGPLVVTVPGFYTADPTSLTGEPVTGGGLAGATVDLTMMGTGTAIINIIFVGLALGVAVTSGATAVVLGRSLASVTPTWTGSLVAGDAWKEDLLRPGIHATPISQDQQTLTIYVYRDGNFHKITGCMGSCKITGKAGEYLRGSFTFKGQFFEAAEAAFPSTGVRFECTDPFQWEEAQVDLHTYSEMPAENITIDLMNTVVIRPDASHSDGYNGWFISGRDIKCDIDPEAIGEAKWRQWYHFSNSTIMTFHCRVGDGVAHNTVYFMSNTAQMAGTNYVDKNTLLYYNTSLEFSQEQDNGDDDFRIVFA